MKRHWIATFVTFFTLVLLAGTLVAAETKDRRRPGARPDGPKRAGRRPGGAGRMPDVGLTDAQKKEIEAIRKDAMAEIKDAKPEERKAIFEEMRKAIQGVFTEEQLAKLKKARQQGGRQRPDLGLTDEQKTAMAKIRKEAMAKVKDAKPEQRKAILEQMKKDIEKLLTAEQLEKLKKARQGGQRGRGFPDIGLTDEQKEKMAAIRKEAMAKIKDAKPADRKAAFEQMKKDIEALLTDEQLEKFKKARQGGQRDGGIRRGDRKGRRPGGAQGRRGGGDRPRRKRPASE